MNIQQLSKREHWQNCIANWKSTGKSARQWCLEHNVPPSSLKYWKDKFSDQDLDKRSFIEISAEVSTGVTIKYKGLEVYVDREFDEQTLSRCLKVIRGASC